MTAAGYERFAQLSESQRIEFLARLATNPAAAERLRLSDAQRRVWFLERISGGAALYNLPSAFRFRGRFSVAAVRYALTELVRRHEVLRMRYADVLGEPVQLPSGVLPEWPVIDLSRLPEDERERELSQLTEADLRTPFELAGGPLIRASVLRLGENDHALLVNLHHSVGDGWSLGLFFDQLEQLYDAHLAGRPAPPAPVGLRYLDYVGAQRRWLASPAADRALEFWRAELADPPVAPSATPVAPSATPAARTGGTAPAEHPDAEHERGRIVSARLEPAATEALRALGRDHGATLFMVLLGVYTLGLRSCWGRDDLLIGSPVAGRTEPGSAETIGLFVNTAVFRVRLDRAATFERLLAEIRQTALGVYAHQDAPFDWLIDKLGAPRFDGRNPLFSAFLSVEGFSERTLRLGGTVGEDIEAYGGSSWFDLSLWIGERADGGLRIDLNYAVDRIDQATATGLIDTVVELAGRVTTSPDLPLAELAPGAAEPAAAPADSPTRLASPELERTSSIAQPRPDTALPFGGAQRVVAETWAALLELPEVTADDDFFDLGGRSLVALQAVARINEVCGTELTPIELFEAPTVSAYARLVEQHSTRASTALRTLRAGSGPTILCLPPVDGDVLCYAGLAAALDTSRPVRAGVLPGSYGQGSPLGSIEELAEHYLRLCRAEPPAVLLGWSLGGVIAVELASQLAAVTGARPAVLLLDSPAPGPGEPLDLIADFSYYLAKLAGREDYVTTEQIGDAAALRRWAIETGAHGAELPEERFHALFELYATNLRALREYTLPSYDGPLGYFAAAEDAAEARWLPWQDAFGPDLAPRLVPGDHYSMIVRPQVGVLAAELGHWCAAEVPA